MAKKRTGKGKSKKAPKKKPAKKPRVAGRPALKKGPFAASVPPASARRRYRCGNRAGIAPAGRHRESAPQRAATGTQSYDTDLDKNPANFLALTPLSFLERAAKVFPDRTAIIHGKMRRNYEQYYERSRRLASALVQLGIKKGDTVAPCSQIRRPCSSATTACR